MIKYYTRACNFYYGKQAKVLIKKTALPLCGNKKIAFNRIEIYARKKNKITSKFLDIKNIKKLKKNERIKVSKDLKI